MFRDTINDLSTYDLLEDICLIIDTIELRERNKTRYDNYQNDKYNALIASLAQTRNQIKSEIH